MYRFLDFYEKLDAVSFNTLFLDFQNRYFILFPRFLGVFRKELAPGFAPEIFSPGKKEQIFGKNPPAAALDGYLFFDVQSLWQGSKTPKLHICTKTP